MATNSSASNCLLHLSASAFEVWLVFFLDWHFCSTADSNARQKNDNNAHVGLLNSNGQTFIVSLLTNLNPCSFVLNNHN